MSTLERFLEFKADLTLRQTLTPIDLTPYIMDRQNGGIGRIRITMNPLRREIDAALAGIMVDNAEGEFSPFTGTRLWGSNFYQGARVRVYARWIDPTTRTVIVDWTQVFGGKVERLLAASTTARAELKIVDAYSAIRNRNVPQSLVGEMQAIDTPANIALHLLGAGYAGIEAEWIDEASFTTASDLEAGFGLEMSGFDLPSASWSSVFDTVLKHGNATFKIGTDGKISYFTWDPILAADLADPVATLKGGTNLIDLRWATGWQDVRNSIRTLARGSQTAGSPQQVSTSVDEWGEIFEQDLNLEYMDDESAVELNGARIIELQAVPPVILEADVHMEPGTWPIEALDRVEIFEEKLGFNGETYQIIGVEALPNRHMVTLTLWNNSADEETWLICNRSGHKLDDVYRVW